MRLALGIHHCDRSGQTELPSIQTGFFLFFPFLFPHVLITATSHSETAGRTRLSFMSNNGFAGVANSKSLF